ncbi:cleavage and polyadenylation specifity 73 kda [Colletotrichum chrysophilum]|nr:cleavage and polyadenylation specifity 73 kda [Colletotrichum chrysophilum]
MFLEAQFGADNVNPVAEPRLPAEDPSSDAQPKKLTADGESDGSMDVSEDDGSEAEQEKKLAARRKAEIERLHKIGIPVPGVKVKVDKMEAVVWLEDLEVECSHKAFADRVRRVCEHAAEVTAPLWG